MSFFRQIRAATAISSPRKRGQDKIIETLCLRNDVLNAMRHREDHHCQINSAETIPTALVASLFLRVLLALDLLKHELGEADEDSYNPLRTDCAMMYACGLRAYQIPSTGLRCHHAVEGTKTLELITQITQRCHRDTQLRRHVHSLQQESKHIMWSFGRQC